MVSFTLMLVDVELHTCQLKLYVKTRIYLSMGNTHPMAILHCTTVQRDSVTTVSICTSVCHVITHDYFKDDNLGRVHVHA